jgi:hypothetical protein
LADLVRSSGKLLVGQVPINGYQFAFSPAVEGGQFPGLQIEFRRNRHDAVEIAKRWLTGLLFD